MSERVTEEQCIEWLDTLSKSAAPPEFRQYCRAARDHLRTLRASPVARTDGEVKSYMVDSNYMRPIPPVSTQFCRVVFYADYVAALARHKEPKS